MQKLTQTKVDPDHNILLSTKWKNTEFFSSSFVHRPTVLTYLNSQKGLVYNVVKIVIFCWFACHTLPTSAEFLVIMWNRKCIGWNSEVHWGSMHHHHNFLRYDDVSYFPKCQPCAIFHFLYVCFDHLCRVFVGFYQFSELIRISAIVSVICNFNTLWVWLENMHA